MVGAERPRGRCDPTLPLALAMLVIAGVAGAQTLPEWPRHLERDRAGAAEACLVPGCPVAGGVDSVGGWVDGDAPHGLEAGAETASLLMRQSEITASIMLLERQLRQAELIGKLMEIYGPESRIEMLPGQYRTFAETPAGERVAAELETLRYQRRINQLRLEAEVEAAERHGSGAGIPRVETVSVAGRAGVDEAVTPVLRVHEISGVAGTYQARVTVGGTMMILMRGDIVEGLGDVTVVDRDGVVIRMKDGEIRHSLGR